MLVKDLGNNTTQGRAVFSEVVSAAQCLVVLYFYSFPLYSRCGGPGTLKLEQTAVWSLGTSSEDLSLLGTRETIDSESSQDL